MAKERVGYALGYGKFTNVKEMAAVMKQAEERGFEMAFFSETVELMRDSVTSLAAIGLATKRLKLGTTQIVRLRGPVVMQIVLVQEPFQPKRGGVETRALGWSPVAMHPSALDLKGKRRGQQPHE